MTIDEFIKKTNEARKRDLSRAIYDKTCKVASEWGVYDKAQSAYISSGCLGEAPVKPKVSYEESLATLTEQEKAYQAAMDYVYSSYYQKSALGEKAMDKIADATVGFAEIEKAMRKEWKEFCYGRMRDLD